MCDIAFEPVSHAYSYMGRDLESVSKVLGRLKPPFDVAAMSHKVAAKNGLKQCDILQQWDDKRNAACERGKSIHAAIESFLTGCGTSESTAPYRNWLEWWSGKMQPVGIEYIVGDIELGIAGTIDLISFSPKTNANHIFDWKTNEKFDCKNKWNRKLLNPFQDLDDCDLEIYSLQVSLYRIMMERRGLAMGDSWICHLSSKICRPYRALDYRERLLAWLQVTSSRTGPCRNSKDRDGREK